LDERRRVDSRSARDLGIERAAEESTVIDVRSGREEYQPWDRHSGRFHRFSFDSAAVGPE
jgi:hypothetical protein